MQKNILLLGASSAIAQCLVESYPENNYIAVSTKASLKNIYSEFYNVEEYNASSLPNIDSQLDGLVYFPGTINLKPFNRINQEDFLRDFNINVLGAINSIQKYLPNLKKSNGASIVLISTVAVDSGFTFHSSISTSKGAIQGLTKALAAEFAPAVRVNCVAPSLTHTPLASQLLSTAEKIEASDKRQPLKKTGLPKDIASAIHFLLSGESSWVTGQILHIDGGLSTIKI